MSRWFGLVLAVFTIGSGVGGMMFVLWRPLLTVRVFGATADGQFFERDEGWSYARLHPQHVVPLLLLIGGWSSVYLVGTIASARGALWGVWLVWVVTFFLVVRMGWIFANPSQAFSSYVPPQTVFAYLITTLFAVSTALFLLLSQRR